MDLNWFQNLIYGMVSGLTEILPVSAQAHRLVLQKIFGIQYVPGMTLLLIHIGTLLAVFLSCQNHLLRMQRARHLAKIPKKRRKRPLDAVSLMDHHLLMTMTIPVLLAFILGFGLTKNENNLFLTSSMLFLNGIVLYIPQYVTGSNRDARTLNRIQGFYIGIGAAFSSIPGVSAIGMATSVGQVLGEDRKYSFQMALLLELPILVILIVEDILKMAAAGFYGISLRLVMQSLLGALAAFFAAFLGIKLMGKLAESHGFSAFGLYCWAVAIISFILTLLV